MLKNQELVRRGFTAAPASYLFKASKKTIDSIYEIKENLREERPLVFVICTNEFDWAKTEFTKEKLKEFLRGRFPDETLENLFEKLSFLYLENIKARETVLCFLTQCDHNILTVGTFGWWGAFLNKNNFQSTKKINTDIYSKGIENQHIVIYYKKQFREGWELSNEIKLEDLFLSNWIGMED